MAKQKFTGKRLNIKSLVNCGLFASLIAVCSWIYIPAAVPFTMQVFAVFVSVAILGGRLGMMSVLTYILLGFSGAPVFAGFSGGYASLIGPTGGYILGFIGIAGTMWLFEVIFGSKLWATALGMFLGLLVCYSFGTAWFIAAFAGAPESVTLGFVLAKCVLPFVVPDLLKALLALIVSKRLKSKVKL